MLSYTVQPGDTLSAIAAVHGESLAALEAANPSIGNPDVIFPGQVVATVSGGHVSFRRANPAPSVVAAPYVRSVPAPVSNSNTSCLDKIAGVESTHNPEAVNPSSGTYGLFQFLPGTGPGAGASVAQQYAAGHSYAVSRYGSDCAGWAHEQADHWW